MLDFLLRPFRRRYGSDKHFYAAIDDMFGFIPNNIELYKVALIHKSASVELEDGSHINNERLEFLGDAVIESVTSDYLFIEFPDSDEGFLTQVRSKMVSRQSLNRIASILGLDKHVISNAAGNSTQKHIYGDAFEAMMGAIYLDQGYDFVNRLLINEIFAKHLSIDEVLKSETDFKSRLIEWCQKNRYTIEFRTDTDRSASSARPLFHSVVYVDGIAIGHGHGDSKKAAEQNAAYSVSQTQNTSIDDENSARILDKLDRMSS
jgi:ribonuclease-3